MGSHKESAESQEYDTHKDQGDLSQYIVHTQKSLGVGWKMVHRHVSATWARGLDFPMSLGTRENYGRTSKKTF